MPKITQAEKRKRPAEDKRLSIIGVGLGPEDLTAKHLDLIAKADVLIGGRRLLAHFSDSRAEKLAIGKDLDAVIAFITQRLGRCSIVVLASGDPLFYGIGTKLTEAFGSENITVYPNVSSVAAACARIKEPWGGLRVVSLHGRHNAGELLRVLGAERAAAVLTDPVHNPAWLAGELRRRGLDRFRICVLEALGSPSEHYAWYDLNQAEGMAFKEPNLVILKMPLGPEPGPLKLSLGTPDEAFTHAQGLITKSEVRAVTLAKLRLLPGQTLWDLGAGSGSVAIEATLLLKEGRVVAVEKDAERIALIRTNAKRFGVRHLRIVQATLPEGLAGLPSPDRIFIGGGGKDLGAIITAAARYLRPDGVMVVNAVLLSNLTTVLETFKQLGYVTEVVQVQVQRGREMPWGERLEALNPVWIVSGIKGSKGSRDRGVK
jgi:precorrin-6B C5,15-methyltransferase / cobalt-precorrin-6B C5,C15-methyltransferase